MCVAFMTTLVFFASSFLMQTRASNKLFTKFAQTERSIKGVVLDVNGEPIIGATVVVLGTTIGSVSDIDGNVVIANAPANSKLSISYLGYTSVTIPATDNFSVILKEDALTVGEIVVIGYGGQKRSSLSTSISTVKLGDEIKSRPTGLLNSLQGQIAGVTISSNGGDPMKGSNIVIRGQGSRNGDPVLFIVDGVPGAPYNDQDVETITVLKDAAAASIYGANVGSGGVILVTTKKAKAGATKVNFKAQYGIQQATNLPNMLNATEYNKVRADAASVSGMSVPPGCDPSVYSYGAITRTDWMDEIFRTGQTQNYSLSISGGSEQITASTSVEYRKTEGTLNNTFSHQLGFNSFISFQIAPWISFSERISYKYFNGQGNVKNAGHKGVISAARFYPRSATPYEYDQEGNLMYSSGGTNPLFGGTVPLWAKDLGVAGTYGEVQNPVASLARLNQYQPQNTLFSTSTLEVKPFEGFTLRSDFTASGNFNRSEIFYAKIPEIGKPYLRNSRNISSSMAYGYLSETVASYENYLGEHHLSVMAGMSYKYDIYRDNSTTVYDFPDENDNAQHFDNGTDWTLTKPSETFSQEASTGFFARASYSYNDRFFGVASIRRDASSKLYYENNSGVFPSFSGAWKLSSESFMEEQEVFDLIKVRASWGKIGNIAAVDNYSYASKLVSTGDFIYLGNTHQNPVRGLGLQTIPNLALKWESSAQTNIGLDLAFLQHRLTATIDVFSKKTEDLIDSMPVPSVGGLQKEPFANIGSVRNKGLEISLDYSDTNEAGFSYSVSGNVSFLDNKVLDLGDREFMAHDEEIRFMYPLRSAVGESWYSYFLVETDGIFQSQTEIDAHVNSAGKKIQPNAQPGDLKFIDRNDDAVINQNGDGKFMGSYMPKVTYGMNANFAYKGFDLSFQLQGVSGNKIFNGVKLLSYASVGQGWNMPSYMLDSWGYNKDSDLPLLSMRDSNGNSTMASDFFLESGAYLRLKNMTVGYTLPEKWMKNIGADNLNARFYLSGDNLFTLTQYTEIDPEVGGVGMDGGVYPLSRIVSVGAAINF